MKYRRIDRRKRVIIAYALRALAVIVLMGMIALMVCGGVFIAEKVSGKGTIVNTEKNNADTGGSVIAAKDLPDNGTDREEPAQQEPDNRFCIVLDAGHGGNDGGTQGTDLHSNAILEKEVNLAVVMAMKALLEEAGINVVLTRETDKYLSLDERTEVANDQVADLFVSIHCNYFEEDASVKGLECYYYKGSASGKKCAETILDRMEAGGKVETRSARESDFYVLRETEIPAVLVELGFLSNAGECQLLSEKEYQEALAQELVSGILEILHVSA